MPPAGIGLPDPRLAVGAGLVIFRRTIRRGRDWRWLRKDLSQEEISILRPWESKTSLWAVAEEGLDRQRIFRRNARNLYTTPPVLTLTDNSAYQTCLPNQHYPHIEHGKVQQKNTKQANQDRAIPVTARNHRIVKIPVIRRIVLTGPHSRPRRFRRDCPTRISVRGPDFPGSATPVERSSPLPMGCLWRSGRRRESRRNRWTGVSTTANNGAFGRHALRFLP